MTICAWLSPAVEGLDQRALLSAGLGMGHALAAGHVAGVSREVATQHNGTIVKTPTFYEDYVGPRLAQRGDGLEEPLQEQQECRDERTAAR